MHLQWLSFQSHFVHIGQQHSLVEMSQNLLRVQFHPVVHFVNFVCLFFYLNNCHVLNILLAFSLIIMKFVLFYNKLELKHP